MSSLNIRLTQSYTYIYNITASYLFAFPRFPFPLYKADRTRSPTSSSKLI